MTFLIFPSETDPPISRNRVLPDSGLTPACANAAGFSLPEVR